MVYVIFSLSVHWLPIHQHFSWFLYTLGSMVHVFFFFFGIFRAFLLEPNMSFLLFEDYFRGVCVFLKWPII